MRSPKLSETVDRKDKTATLVFLCVVAVVLSSKSLFSMYVALPNTNSHFDTIFRAS